MVVLATAIGAHVKNACGRRQSVVALAILAYLAARALTGGLTYPGSLNSWSPYPVEHWLRFAGFLLPGVFLQEWLLYPLWPVLVHDTAEINRKAAVIGCALPFLLWEPLSRSVGSASAALICALTLVLVMILAGRQRFVLFALVSCAGFLAVSALVQESPPFVIRGLVNPGVPDIDFRITLPQGDALLSAGGLRISADLSPGVPTLFHCPSQVQVNVHVSLPFPASPKGIAAYDKDYATLLKSAYFLDVSGDTRIIHLGPSVAHSSRVSDFGSRTFLSGTGLDIGQIPTDTAVEGGDSFVFELPLQSARGMGTCYVTTPTVNEQVLGIGIKGLTHLATAAVILHPQFGTSLDVTDTSPQPTAVPDVPGVYDWTCFDYTRASTPGQCPAVAVVATGWAGSYGQVAMLVVGSLVSIAAERWFHRVGPDEEGKDGDDAADSSDDDNESAQPDPGGD